MEFGENRTDELHKAYDHIDPKKNASNRHGQQAGDPPKAAKVFYDLAVMEDPPLRCIVGTDAYKYINSKMDTYSENIKKFEKWSNSTDVDE